MVIYGCSVRGASFHCIRIFYAHRETARYSIEGLRQRKTLRN
jgi:hypothetical protein